MAENSNNPGQDQTLTATMKVVVAASEQDLERAREYAALIEKMADDLDRYNVAVGKSKTGGGIGGGPGGAGGGGFGGGYGGGMGRGPRFNRGAAIGAQTIDPFTARAGYDYTRGGFGGSYTDARRNYGPTPWGNAYENPWQNQTSGMPWSPWSEGALPPGGGGFFGAAGAGIRGTANAGGWAVRNMARFGPPVYAAAHAAAGAYNAGTVAESVGGTGSDIFRAGMNSNFVTRNILSGYDTFSGRDSKIQIEQLKAEKLAAVNQRIIQFGSENDLKGNRINITGELGFQLESRRNETRAKIRAMAEDRRVATFDYIDPFAVGGETALRETRARQPVYAERFELAREGKSLSFQARSLGGQMDQAKKEEADLRGAAAEARKKMMGNMDRVNVNSADADAKRVAGAKEVLRIQELLEKNLERQKGLHGDIVEKNKEILLNNKAQRENKLKELQVDSQLLAQRAQVAEGQAERIGRMGPLNRQFAIRAAKLFMETEDPDTIPDEFIAGAEQIIPETVRKKFAKKGDSTPELQWLRENAPNEYRDRMGEASRRAQAMEQQAVKLKFEIDETLQKEWDATINSDKFNEVLKKIVGAQLNLMLDKIDVRQKANVVQPGAGG